MSLKIKQEIVEHTVPKQQVMLRVKQEITEPKSRVQPKPEPVPEIQQPAPQQPQESQWMPQEHQNALMNWTQNYEFYTSPFGSPNYTQNCYYPFPNNDLAVPFAEVSLDNKTTGKPKQRKRAPRKTKKSTTTTSPDTPEREEQKKYLEQVYLQVYSNCLYTNYVRQFLQPYQSHVLPSMIHPSWLNYK